MRFGLASLDFSRSRRALHAKHAASVRNGRKTAVSACAPPELRRDLERFPNEMSGIGDSGHYFWGALSRRAATKQQLEWFSEKAVNPKGCPLFFEGIALDII